MEECYKFQNFAGNNYFLSMLFLTEKKNIFKIAFGQNYCDCRPIFRIFAAHFRTNKEPDFAKKYFAYNIVIKITAINLSRRQNITL